MQFHLIPQVPGALGGVILGLALAGSANAEEKLPAGGGASQSLSLAQALTGGTVDLAFRYRYGAVDDDGFEDKSRASTLRTMFGYRTGEFRNFSAYVQIRNVEVVGPEHYNDTLNGLGTRPPEADPAATEVDQLYLQYEGPGQTSVTVGRRKLKFGNQRFISDLGWRQNNRSFDGVVVENASFDDLKLIYGWANNINRAFTDASPNGNFDDDTDVHLFNAAYTGFSIGRLEAYGYLMNLDGTLKPDPTSLLSTQTWGVNLTGKKKVSDRMSVHYTAEYAWQTDYDDNPRDFELNYWRIEPGLSFSGLTVKVGYEVLESDGTGSFAAPLGLLHAFGGWADKFTPAPAMGLQDSYVNVTWKVGGTGTSLDGLKLVGAYHSFDPDVGSGTLGTEWDAAIIKPFGKHYMVAVHYADYQADAFGADTRKTWFTLGATF